MNIRKAPMFKSVRVPSLPEPGSTRIGTEFHPYWNRVPPVLEPGSTRTVTAFHPYCNGMDMLDGALRIFIL